MAQNVTILGANYSAVPAVELPKTGGGTARFDDASVTTATAPDVASGKIFLSFDGTITIGTASGTANGDVWQDAQGYVHLSDEEGTNVSVDELTVTANGTYTAPSGWAYNPVKVNLPTTTRAVPSISVSSGGLITATSTQTAGLVSAGTETATQQLATQAATTITPTESSQTAVASGRYTTGAVTVGAISSTYVGSGIAQRTSSNLSASGATVTAPAGYYASSASKSVASGSATAPASISGTSATLSTGTNTLTLSKTVSVTPSVSAGYVSSGTAGNSSVSLTASVTTKAAATITPTTSDQTISSGTYLTGTQTIKGDANLIAGNIKKDVVLFNVTGTYEGGGGGGAVEQKQINFIDYDCTILYSYTATEWASVSALPANPSHDGLTAQGWNWTKAQIDAQLTAAPGGNVWVGQMYITASGDTEIDVRFDNAARLSPYLGIAVNGTVTVDWGDNSATSTVTGSSLYTQIMTQHNYSTIGDYTIKIHVVSGSFAFYGSSTYPLLSKNNATLEANIVYSNCVQAVRIGGNASFGAYAFCNCYSLKYVTIPSISLTSTGSYTFQNCYSLASVTIPSGATSISSYTFYYSFALESVSIPGGVTSVGQSAFYSCHSLESVTIPTGVTRITASSFRECYSLAAITIPSGVNRIDNYAFTDCRSLANITIPSGVTTIGTSPFYSCYGMAEYHIKPTTPPPLSSDAFTNIQPDCIIYVPSASLATYKAASYWSTYASQMVGE